MAIPLLQGAFTVGEVAPALFGRFDLARLHVAATTMRNMFVRYQGGASSRPGTAFVGFSKQTGRSFAPRLVPFQFNINQGLMLEFGNQYMRVIENGAHVLEAPYAITAITQASPAVVTVAPTVGVATATANTGGVLSSYAPGDLVTLAGGTVVQQGVLEVTTTKLIAVQLNAAGAGYAPGDTITLAGGVPSVRAVLTVATVGGGGALATFTITTAGDYTGNPAGFTFTQFATSGAGAGATFRDALMAPNTLGIETPGVYISIPPDPVAQDTTTGSGIGATFNLTTVGVNPLFNGDWVRIEDVSGMTQVNGRVFVIDNATATTFSLQDVYGNDIDSTTYSPYAAGGTAARLYTLATPYSDADLEYLKYTQSADVMSLCLVNQMTLAEYPPFDLARITNSNWTLTEVTGQSTVEPPATVTAVASAGGTVSYQYVVTSVDPNNGSESIASPIAAANLAVDIAGTAGAITITWNQVEEGIRQYNVYKAAPAYASTAVPVGALFGYAGTAYGTRFVDSNIIADFSQVPPLRRDPFARGQIINADPVAGGAGYTTITFTINTATGSGAVLTPVIIGGALSAIIVQQSGRNYAPGDTVTVTGNGAGATAVLTVGPQRGTFPGVVSYFQQRRAYGFTLNNPDTYFLSQPAAFTNFDDRIPSIATDAIIGSPWAVQVNGIQAFVNMPGGLVVLTGKEAWQLTGAGGSSLNPQPLTPTTQQAQPQAFNGCHDHIPPIKIDYDIIYVQAKGAIVRDLAYQFYTNIYTGADLTLNSSHLFLGQHIREWTYAEEPFKVVIALREDGIMLALTYVKPQEVAGWSRHDTNGRFMSVASITENFTDAVYVATQRFPTPGAAYMIERFDDHFWRVVEDAWCVDCALALPRPEPDATLSVSSSTGLGAISGFTGLVGGQGYSAAAYGVIVDDNGQGPGTGATVGLTIVGGVITAVNLLTAGTGYTYPRLDIYDPAGSAGGSGASAMPVLDNSAIFIASANVFAASDIGSVIRAGGGAATITAFTSPTQVTANITSPIVEIFPDDAGTPLPQTAGNWTMTQPVSQITGLYHLTGMTVTGLYDGHVLDPVVVPADGTLNLPQPATAVVIGLGYECQLQTPYVDTPGVTIQGQRKKIGDVTVRLDASRGVEAGSNQPDGSTLSPPRIAPIWHNMDPIEDKGRPPYGSTIVPLYTGDTRLPVIGGFDAHGQVALRQRLPLPFNLLAIIPEIWPGDLPQNEEPRQPQRNRQPVPA